MIFFVSCKLQALMKVLAEFEAPQSIITRNVFTEPQFLMSQILCPCFQFLVRSIHCLDFYYHLPCHLTIDILLTVSKRTETASRKRSANKTSSYNNSYDKGVQQIKMEVTKSSWCYLVDFKPKLLFIHTFPIPNFVRNIFHHIRRRKINLKQHYKLTLRLLRR